MLHRQRNACGKFVSYGHAAKRNCGSFTRHLWCGSVQREASCMVTPLDPIIAQIIPLLPLRDPTTMTPQSARDALRALADSRAAVPPPPVAEVKDIQVKGAAGPLNARVYRNNHDKAPTVGF